MSLTNSPENPDTALGRDLLYAARYYLGRWSVLLALAAVALVVGLAFNWSWLVAAGIAPLLLGVLPCAAMCALGLCMNKMVGRSCSTDAASEQSAEITRGARKQETVVQKPAILLESPAPGTEINVAPVSTRNPESAEERSKTDA